MTESVETYNFYPALQRNVTPTASGSEVVSYTSDLGNGGPILTLIHGYPQSSLIWRHLVPLLLPKVSLFIPELPGYGISTPISAGTGDHTKRAVGHALLDALAQVFDTNSSSSSPSSPRQVILAGHDRGARICHRLAVDATSKTSSRDSSSSSIPSIPEHKSFFLNLNLTITGLILLDILPTKSQWDFFSSPSLSQNYFHWPLLANVELAVPMITAFGIDKWVRGGHLRLVGSASDSKARIMSEEAVDIHVKLFENEKKETIKWTCEDYKAGAQKEVDEQVEDLRRGRRVEVDTLVMYSREKLGRGGGVDVEGVWRGDVNCREESEGGNGEESKKKKKKGDQWVGDGVELEVVGVEDGRGHFLPEEAYDVVGERVVRFLERFGL